MNVFRVLLNSVSVPWIQCMETVLNELTNWEILTNSLTVETVELVEKTQPDIVAWKIEDDLNCLDLYELKKRCPMVLPVIIVNDPNQLKMRQFVEYGACGCLPARLRPRQIVAAMELIAQAGICCIPRFYTEQQQQMDFKQVIGLNKLTIREQEIFPFYVKIIPTRKLRKCCRCASPPSRLIYPIYIEKWAKLNEVKCWPRCTI